MKNNRIGKFNKWGKYHKVKTKIKSYFYKNIFINEDEIIENSKKH